MSALTGYTIKQELNKKPKLEKKESMGCPQLSYLNLEFCDKITDEGVIALADNCLQLSSLDLGRHNKITDDGVTMLREARPNIKINGVLGGGAGGVAVENKEVNYVQLRF